MSLRQKRGERLGRRRGIEGFASLVNLVCQGNVKGQDGSGRENSLANANPAPQATSRTPIYKQNTDLCAAPRPFVGTGRVQRPIISWKLARGYRGNRQGKNFEFSRLNGRAVTEALAH